MFIKNKTFLIIIAITISVVSFTSSTLVDECNNGVPTPIYVNIKHCRQSPCHFKKGEEVIMTMNFTAPISEPIKTLESKLDIQLWDAETMFVLCDPNACKGLINTHCPLEENEPAVYKQTVQILSMTNKDYTEYLTATFRMLYNRNHKQLVCFKIMCIID